METYGKLCVFSIDVMYDMELNNVSVFPIDLLTSGLIVLSK